MLYRVRKLELSRIPPWHRLLGPIEEFEAEVQAGMAAGRYDPRDMPLVLASVQRWVREGDWR